MLEHFNTVCENHQLKERLVLVRAKEDILGKSKKHLKYGKSFSSTNNRLPNPLL